MQVVKLSSLSRYCCFYLANNGKWYVELANQEYGDRDDATTYGPFNSRDDAEGELEWHSNPGGSYDDDSGTKPPPAKSPNGMSVQPPSRRSRGMGRFMHASGALVKTAEGVLQNQQGVKP